MLPVSEVFVSIQGEGLRTGLPTLFVRMAGCNLADMGTPCSFCDSRYAWDKSSGTEYDFEDLVRLINTQMETSHLHEICLTGGEPLWHPGIPALIWELKKHNTVTVETNGSLPIWNERCHWSMDIKCPSAGNSEYNCLDNLRLLGKGDQVKFIISDRADFDFAREIVLSNQIPNIIFQPSWKGLPAAKLATWLINDKELHNVRLGMQLHKIIWPRQKRGV